MARDDGEWIRTVLYIHSAFLVGQFAEQVSGRIDVMVRPGGANSGSASANGRVPRQNGTHHPGWDGLAAQVEELHARVRTTNSTDPAGADADGSGSRTDKEAGR